MDTPPPFQKLLQNPLVKVPPLPSDFVVGVEAEHLARLYDSVPAFHDYDFHAFVHSGGSGMVFKVSPLGTTRFQALKIARYKLMDKATRADELARSLSPVSQEELQALERLSHPNIVRLFRAIGQEERVLAISTTYVDPRPFDVYIRHIVARGATKHPALEAFSPRRLRGACHFLIDRCLEIASALEHMHDQGIYHFDLKPANILISGNKRAVITDLGACVHTDRLTPNKPIRVHFDWVYAHPDLRSIINDPGGLTGGGLKASAEVNPGAGGLARFDLFALGRTMQELLAVLEMEFGERCHAEYSYRYLHVIASLLLDGRNTPLGTPLLVEARDGRRFVTDAALGYPVALYQQKPLSSAAALADRLRRHSRDYSWNGAIPELDVCAPDTINIGPSGNVPFTSRIAAIANHPAMRRLKGELQLGWVKDVYPAAAHNRWSHSIGVLGATVRYFNSLLADPEVPTFRILAEQQDVLHGFVAALLHDIGQATLGHDFEAACPQLYHHELTVSALLDESYWGQPTLRAALSEQWPDVDLRRVLDILRPGSNEPGTNGYAPQPLDGLIADVLDGPIDADKFDYLLRDSVGCGVVYGRGVDLERLLHSLTVDVIDLPNGGCRLALAYKAKGASAVHSMLLGRFQMYQAVYWHHAVRCLQSMFIHSVAATFGDLAPKASRNFRGARVYGNRIHNMFYHMVICGRPFSQAIEASTAGKQVYALAAETPPLEIASQPALEFVWRFASDSIRSLLLRLARREIYKRVFEAKVEDVGGNADYASIKDALLPVKRTMLATRLEEALVLAVIKKQATRAPRDSTAESPARDRVLVLQEKTLPYLVIDFPIGGVPEELNWPREISDPTRKYIGHPQRAPRPGSVFSSVRKMQLDMASVRVFAAQELHELVTRYLSPNDVRDCVEGTIRSLRTLA